MKINTSRCILNGHTKESIRFFFILSGSENLIQELLVAVTRDNLTVIIGSLIDDDGEGNQNGKTATLHMHHAFLYISLSSANYEVELPNFTFLWRT